jgi:hypothetical protein
MPIDPTRATPRPMHADEYGCCSVCGAPKRLTARGNLYQHQRRNQLGTATGKQCEGAGKPPSGPGY